MGLTESVMVKAENTDRKKNALQQKIRNFQKFK